MDLIDIMKIGATAMTAQRTRMSVISSNMANATTTRTGEGGPYRRRDVIFSELNFDDLLSQELDHSVTGVEVSQINVDTKEGQLVFDPDHPDANADGYVRMPNVNIVQEMTDMMGAARSYEADVAIITTAKQMARKALTIGEG